MKIQLFIYPGMTLLDLVGPLQVVSAWPEAQMQFVARTPGPVASDSAAQLVATHSYAEAWPDPDLLLVPGGGEPTYALLTDEQAVDFLAARGSRASWVTSVCTGALLLGAAGLLHGYRATSHWYAIESLAAFGATPVHERWVIDRNRGTGGGVTAGIDFGLALTASILGEDYAKAVQLVLEYSPQPPFRAGTPAEAGPTLTGAVRSRFDSRPVSMQAQVRAAAARLAGRAAT